MRILIDECLDPGICDFLTGYQVTTVGEANWQSTADNQLIQLAQGNFDVLLTLDRGFEPMAEALRHAGQAVQPGEASMSV